MSEIATNQILDSDFLEYLQDDKHTTKDKLISIVYLKKHLRDEFLSNSISKKEQETLYENAKSSLLQEITNEKDEKGKSVYTNDIARKAELSCRLESLGYVCIYSDTIKNHEHRNSQISNDLQFLNDIYNFFDKYGNE